MTPESRPPPSRPCDEFAELVWLAGDDELDVGERASLDAHLEQCTACRSKADESRRVRQGLAQLRGPNAPLGFAQRTLGRIDASSAATPSIAPVLRRTWGWRAVAAAAAVVALVTIVVHERAGRSDANSSVPDQVASAPVDAAHKLGRESFELAPKERANDAERKRADASWQTKEVAEAKDGDKSDEKRATRDDTLDAGSLDDRRKDVEPDAKKPLAKEPSPESHGDEESGRAVRRAVEQADGAAATGGKRGASVGGDVEPSDAHALLRRLVAATSPPKPEGRGKGVRYGARPEGKPADAPERKRDAKDAAGIAGAKGDEARRGELAAASEAIADRLAVEYVVVHADDPRVASWRAARSDGATSGAMTVVDVAVAQRPELLRELTDHGATVEPLDEQRWTDFVRAERTRESATKDAVVAKAKAAETKTVDAKVEAEAEKLAGKAPELDRAAKKLVDAPRMRVVIWFAPPPVALPLEPSTPAAPTKPNDGH